VRIFFQKLIVSAVKICKQCLQTMLQLLGDFVPQSPTGALPMDPTGTPVDLLGYSPLQMKIYGDANTDYKRRGVISGTPLTFCRNSGNYTLNTN